MSITLYTAPSCIRCNVVKGYLNEHNLEYRTVDFQEQKQEFNKFYRENRPKLYRNPEGVEFPLFDDGEAILQGSGIILAYLLSGDKMKEAVLRSDYLHGWISGLYPSICPKEENENFLKVVDYLAKGGLKVYIQPDGRNPELLELLIKSGKLSRISLNILGTEEAYKDSFGGALSKEDLAKSIELVKNFENGEVRLLISPTKREDGSWSWTTKEEAEAASKFVADACGSNTIDFAIATVTELMPQGLEGLDEFPKSDLLPYRGACRRHLFKADVAKDE